MILLKGTKRIFEKSIHETSSNSNTRTIDMFGVSSYDELVDVMIPVVSKAGGASGACTININNLGPKNIKIYNGANKVDPYSNWVAINQTYFICYDGTYFIASNINTNASATHEDDDYVIPNTVLDLTNESTSQDITNAFEGTDNIALFKEAIENGYHMTIDLTEESGIGSAIVIYQFYKDSIDTIIIHAKDSIIQYQFIRGDNNTYSSVNKEVVSIGGNTEFYKIPYTVTNLTDSADAATISTAFGGDEKIIEFRNALKNKKVIAVEGEEYEQYIAIYQHYAEEMDMISLFIPALRRTITLSFTADSTTGLYTSVEVTNDYLANTNSITSQGAEIHFRIDTIMQNLPRQLWTWALGDGTSYPPATPDEDTLTAYMTDEVKLQLEKFVTDGTIIKAANVMSGADRKSTSTYLFTVHKLYSSMYNGDYEYNFNNLSGGTDFYMYWDVSESKWFWNQKGLIQGEPCFVEGTKVLTPNGLVNIEDIKAGDEVISYNFNTLQNETKKVTETYTHTESVIYTIEANEEKIQSTGDHPYYVIDKLAVEAKNLSATDDLMNVAGQKVDINSVSYEIADLVNVYEIAVEDTHTYYVGNNSILVYNEPAVIK